MDTPIEVMDSTILRQWADLEPLERYPLIGQCLSMFGRKNDGDEKDLSSLFLSILDYAPDKRHFLGNIFDRLYPNSWSGALADVLVRRKGHMMKLAEHLDKEVRGWATETIPELDGWIEIERGRDREGEESFE